MRGFLERLGVDYDQWRTLVRVFLRIDFGALRGAYGHSAAMRSGRQLLLVALVYGLAGVMPAVIIARSSDAVFAAAIMTTICGFMVLSTLLAGEGVSIVSPDDHLVLGFRPVSSRTYLAVRMTSLFARTVVIAALTGSLPVAAFLLAGGGLHPARALAAAVAVLGTASALTLAIVSLYGWLLRVAGPSRLMRFMSYTQMSAQFITWAGLVFGMRGLGALGDITITGTWWMFLYPPAWFASYIGLVDGQIGAGTVVPALLSLALLAGLARTIGGKLSLEHGEQLARLTTAAATRTRAGSSRWLGLLGSETRAVAILVRSQFRNDLKFRLGILALLPVSLIYLFLGAQNGPIDPFVARPGGHGPGDTGLIQLALFFLPTTLLRVITTSDSFRASWIFHASPADRPRLVLAGRDIITVFFLVPYLLLLAGLFAYFYGSITHGLVHALFLGCLSYLMLQLGVLMNPQLPLSRPANKDTNAAQNFALMFAGMFIGFIAYMVMVMFVYRTTLRMIVAFALLLAVAIAADQWTRARVKATLRVMPAEGL